MAIRDILIIPDPRLRLQSEPVNTVDKGIRTLVDDMFETMYDAPGVGLAAPQVNVSKRLFVVDAGDDADHPEGTVFTVANPKVELAEEEVELTEGCLSVPGMVGEITRFAHVAISGLDRNGNKIRLEGRGLFAQALQHEIDHLNGVLYIDTAKNIRPARSDEEHEIAEQAAAQSY